MRNEVNISPKKVGNRMVKLSLESIRKFVGDFRHVYFGASERNDVDIPFEIKARQLLKYAEYDLNNEYEHHLVNSLSNIKRAIDCQLDSLLIGFGLYDKSKNERWNFPQKIDLLNQIGIVSPRILKKINQKRNLLEHEYKNPTKEEVEDALDVAILFMAYTEKHLLSVWKEIEIEDDAEDWFSIEVDYKHNKIILKTLDKTKKEITADNEEYREFIKLVVTVRNNV